MARYIFQGTWKDGSGRSVSGGLVSVYLAGTLTPANVYAASAGGATIQSVLSEADGHFKFYVDEATYGGSQKFKIILAKNGFISKTYDDIAILPETALAEIMQYDPHGTTLVCTTAGTAYKWITTTTSINDGIDTSAVNDWLSITQSGTYEISMDGSLTVDKACQLTLGIYINDTLRQSLIIDIETDRIGKAIPFARTLFWIISAGGNITIKASSTVNSTTIGLLGWALKAKKIK